MTVTIGRGLGPYLLTGLQRHREMHELMAQRGMCRYDETEESARRGLEAYCHNTRWNGVTLQLGALSVLLLRSAVDYVHLENPHLPTPPKKLDETTLRQLQELTISLLPDDDGIYFMD